MKRRKCVGAVLLAGVALLSACGQKENADSIQTTVNVSESTSNDSVEETVEADTTGNTGGTDETIDTGKDNPEENKIIDGFYNRTEGDMNFVRVDFEVKTVNDTYMALFYAQYTEVDTYEYYQVLYGDKTGDNTYEFTGVDEKCIVSWDGADKLNITGNEFSGTYERAARDGYGEDDYMIADIPSYEADANIEEGIELDSTLAKAVRAELGYSADQFLTRNDLESVTYLATWDYEIASVKGISNLKNLEEIHFGTNYISDISEMSELERIQVIDLSNGYVKEIPDFSKCADLRSLYLGGNMIEDVTPIAKIPNIEFVDLNANFIKSIAPLKNAKSLQTLCIYNNCILDYGEIKDCKNLIDAYNQNGQCTYEEALALENRAKEIVASFPSELSELELEKTIYKYIKDNMYYDESDRPTTPYGYCGIMNGWGVCGDYAQAFSLLANHAGLEAIECGSDTHAWNIVKIDGVYYHCDALWDEDVTEWTHFNKSTGYIYNLPDHMHDLRRYPICDISMSVLEYCDSFGVQ